MCDDGTVNVGQIINEEHKPEECRLWFLQGDIAGREWGDAGDAGSWSGKAQLGIWIAQTRG
jgi:hypothetical protein